MVKKGSIIVKKQLKCEILEKLSQKKTAMDEKSKKMDSAIELPKIWSFARNYRKTTAFLIFMPKNSNFCKNDATKPCFLAILGHF